MKRKFLILTEGYSDPHSAKTARNLIYYRPDEVVAILDKYNTGKLSSEILGTGEVKIVGSISEASDANILLIGVAPSGGFFPEEWRGYVLEAIRNKMDIISGLHDFLSEDEEFSYEAERYNVKITDIRKNDESEIVHRKNINEKCLRVLTVGNDCSLGKMVTSIELNNALVRKGYDSKFVATGQTGIIIEGDGCPIDSVVGDYINGSAEQLVLKNQHHDILIIEGQGSIVHPRYSSVSLGLLHGSMPQAIIMCYEMGRKYVRKMEGIKIPDMDEVIELHLKMANIMHPCKLIGFALNSSKFSKEEADKEKQMMEKKYNIPVCDVLRHGSDELTEAIIKEKELLKKSDSL